MIKGSCLFLSLLLCSIGSAVSSQPQEAWVARYHGPGYGDDRPRAMAIDSDGSVYVAGASFGAVYNYFEYTTLKYDADGNPLWLARYHDPVNAGDEAVALALDGKGNVYVTGTVCTQFRIIQGCIHWAFGTIKYDPQGRLLWVSRYHTAGDGDDFAVGIAVDAEGNVYVTGRSFPDSSHSNYTTVKYDTSGREIWVARYIGPRSYDRVTAIAVNGQGHVYVTGQSGVDGSVTDYTTIKYTSLGEEVWVARYHGPGADPWTARETFTSPEPASALGERTAMPRSSMTRRETKSGPLDTKAGAEPSRSSAMSKEMSTSPDAALQMSTRTTQRSSTIRKGTRRG